MEGSRLDAEAFVEALMNAARAYPGMPVAVIDEEGSLKVGVMSLPDPTDEDWFYHPVPIEDFEFSESSSAE